MISYKRLRKKTQKYKEKNFKKKYKKLLKTVNKEIKRKARKGLSSYSRRTNRPFSSEERELLIRYYNNLGYKGHWYNDNEFIIQWW